MNAFQNLGTNTMNFVKNNGSEIIATGVVAGGWAAAAATGAKVVTGACLVGGGMFLTVAAHAVVTQSTRMLGRGLKSLYNMATKAPVQPQPAAAAAESTAQSRPDIQRIQVP